MAPDDLVTDDSFGMGCRKVHHDVALTENKIRAGEAIERVEHEGLRAALSAASAEWLGVRTESARAG
jgi:hypothetical protein